MPRSEDHDYNAWGQDVRPPSLEEQLYWRDLEPARAKAAAEAWYRKQRLVEGARRDVERDG